VWHREAPGPQPPSLVSRAVRRPRRLWLACAITSCSLALPVKCPMGVGHSPGAACGETMLPLAKLGCRKHTAARPKPTSEGQGQEEESEPDCALVYSQLVSQRGLVMDFTHNGLSRHNVHVMSLFNVY